MVSVRVMQSWLVVLLLLLLLLLAVAGTGTPSALPTSLSAYPSSTGSPTGQPSAKQTLKNNDDTDDDKMDRYISRDPFQLAKKALSTILLIPSIIAGTLLSAFLSRLIWRKKSTAFDSLVLAMTLWQLLLDLMLLFDPYIVSFNVPKAFCGSRCRSRVMSYKSGDDGYSPGTDDDHTFGRYDVFDVELQLFYFFKQVSYQASSLESTVIVLTALHIVFYCARPQIVLTHFFVIQLAIFLLSLIFPLVYLLWWFDAISGMPPFNLKGTKDASYSSQKFAGSIDAAMYSIVLASILINVISCAAIYWQTATKARKSLSPVKGGVLLELSKRLAWYPFVQFFTRIFDAVYYITWWDSPQYPFSNVKRWENGKEVSDGWRHLLATRPYMAIDFLRAILLSPAGLILFLVYFRFSPRAWGRAKKMVEKSLCRLCPDSCKRIAANSEQEPVRSSRWFSPPSHKDHIPAKAGAEAEAGAGAGGEGEQYNNNDDNNSSTKGSGSGSGSESHAGKYVTAKDLDDDQLLVVLESKEDGGERRFFSGGGEISVEMSGLYRSGLDNDNDSYSLRVGGNPLHRLNIAP